MTLEQNYEENNKETEEKYNNIKENAQIVEDLKKDIRTLESEITSNKRNNFMNDKKSKDIEKVLKSTFQSLKTYEADSSRVASRVKTSTLKKEKLEKLKAELNKAVFDVLQENDKLKINLGEAQKKTETIKAETKKVMQASKKA